jgi:CHAD domain-containing protein
LRKRIDYWNIEGKGFSSFSGGLEKTYTRGREAFARAYKTPSTKQFHEWRKRVKYHWYHLRLLSDVWPKQMRVQRKAADKLGDLLGNEHDLAVLRQSLLKEPGAFGRPKNIRRVAGYIDQRRQGLREQARLIGAYLYAEKPRCMTKRIEAYWSAWRRSDSYEKANFYS